VAKITVGTPMWRNGRRNGLKIRWALNGPCRFESGHRQLTELDTDCRINSITNCGLRRADELDSDFLDSLILLILSKKWSVRFSFR